MAKTRRKQDLSDAEPAESGGRAFWKGSISFGLVNIPIALYSAESKQKLSFRLLDRRDFSPVRFRRVNEESGKEVPWDEIVKGYEYEKGEYVVLSDADFERANVKATHTIEITNFVESAQISPLYFDKPYYLTPQKNGEKGYVLLREVLRRTGKIGIGRVVLRTREYLAAIMVYGDILVAELLRFAYELRDPRKLGVPGKTSKLSGRDITMAQQLVQALEEPWKPERFHEQYHDELKKLIDEKIKSGKTKTIGKPARAPAARTSKVVDITELLKRSVQQAQSHSRKAS